MINRVAEWVIVLLHEIAMATYGKCLRVGKGLTSIKTVGYIR